MDILQLEHSMSGTSVPVPRALLKYILNLVLPSLIQTRLRALLPVELGQYFLKASTPGIQLGGKIVVVGPQMTALDANLTITPESGLCFSTLIYISKSNKICLGHFYPKKCVF